MSSAVYERGGFFPSPTQYHTQVVPLHVWGNLKPTRQTGRKRLISQYIRIAEHHLTLIAMVILGLVVIGLHSLLANRVVAESHPEQEKPFNLFFPLVKSTPSLSGTENSTPEYIAQIDSATKDGPIATNGEFGYAGAIMKLANGHVVVSERIWNSDTIQQITFDKHGRVLFSTSITGNVIDFASPLKENFFGVVKSQTIGKTCFTEYVANNCGNAKSPEHLRLCKVEARKNCKTTLETPNRKKVGTFNFLNPSTGKIEKVAGTATLSRTDTLPDPNLIIKRILRSSKLLTSEPNPWEKIIVVCGKTRRCPGMSMAESARSTENDKQSSRKNVFKKDTFTKESVNNTD